MRSLAEAQWCCIFRQFIFDNELWCQLLLESGSSTVCSFSEVTLSNLWNTALIGLPPPGSLQPFGLTAYTRIILILFHITLSATTWFQFPLCWRSLLPEFSSSVCLDISTANLTVHLSRALMPPIVYIEDIYNVCFNSTFDITFGKPTRSSPLADYRTVEPSCIAVTTFSQSSAGCCWTNGLYLVTAHFLMDLYASLTLHTESARSYSHI